MSAAGIVHLYTLCWNEAAMLPFFLRHYDWVDRIHVLDNGSTDESLAILAADPRVTVEPFTVDGDSFVFEEQRLSDVMWKRSRGVADWVMLLDMDEMLLHRDLPGYLARCKALGVTVARAAGYEMVTQRFPSADRPIVEQMSDGVRVLNYDKPFALDPDAIAESNFTWGRHSCRPTGRVKWPWRTEVALAHCKNMGLDYLINRYAFLAGGLKERDIAMDLGVQYRLSAEAITTHFRKMEGLAEPVPGLAGAPWLETMTRDEDRVRASGQVDGRWYLKTYDDVGFAAFDPISHYAELGWREGRRPNAGAPTPAAEPERDPVLAALDARLAALTAA